MFDLGDVPAGVTLPIMFDTYDSNGASVTMTGIATTDIEAYKGTSMTQRSSDNGYALIDTDGIDLDTTTGLQGFSIDLSDNSDSGFWAAGSYYHVCLNSITVDSQTVRVTFRFRIVAAEGVSGTPKADVSAWNGTAVASPATAGYPAVTIKVGTGTGEINLSSGGVPIQSGTGTGQVKLSSGYVAPNWGDVGNPTTVVGLSGTTVKTATDVETDTADIQSRIPAALGANGNIKADLRDVQGVNAPTTLSGTLDVNAKAIDGSTSTATRLGTAYATNTIATNFAACYSDAAGAAPHAGVVDQGTAQSATSTTVVLRAASAFGDNTLIGSRIMVYGSDQAYWQTRPILDSVLSTDTVTVAAWDVTPTGTITYKIFSDVPAAAGSTPPTAGEIADAVWDEATTSHTTSGTFGEQLKTDVDAILADTNELQTDWANGGRLDLILDTAAAGSSGGGGAGGTFAPGTVLNFKFVTTDSTGAGSTASSLAVSCYKDNSTTQSTTGITTTYSGGFDGVAGLVNVAVDTSADGTFYAAGSSFQLVVTAGTADGVALAGQPVGDFHLATALSIPTAAQVATAVRTGTAMTEAYAADGVAPTLEQCLFMIQQKLCDFSISGTTLTVKKMDGSTTAATFTLDSSTAPTSITRAT